MYYSLAEAGGFRSLTLFLDDGPTTIGQSHAKWDDFNKLVSTGELAVMFEDEVLTLLNPSTASAGWLEGISDRLEVSPYGVIMDGEPLDPKISGGIQKILGDDSNNEEHLKAVARFLEKANDNPSMINSERLYHWMLAEGLTLTSDGDFVGYKSVTSVEPDIFDDIFGQTTLPNGDTAPASEVLPEEERVFRASRPGGGITDGFTFDGHVPNYVGAVVEMPRDRVDADGRTECSVGLHVGTYGYASTFGGDMMLLVKVNPRDVVSVPDYDFSKLRACRYTIIAADVPGVLDSKLYIDEEFAPVVSDDEFTKPTGSVKKSEVVRTILDRIKEARGI